MVTGKGEVRLREEFFSEVDMHVQVLMKRVKFMGRSKKTRGRRDSALCWASKRVTPRLNPGLE